MSIERVSILGSMTSFLHCNKMMTHFFSSKKSLLIKISLITLTLLGGGYLAWQGRGQPAVAAKVGCPFCNLSQLVYEGEHASILITHKPSVSGHLLIVPKRHVARFEDLNSSEAAEMQQLVKRVSSVMKNHGLPKDYLLLQKNGKAAGQSVYHVHIHYLPRNENHLIFLARLLLRPLWGPMSSAEMEKQIQTYTIYLKNKPEVQS